MLSSSWTLFLSVFAEVLGLFFFFQAEDGIRDWSVTGVQTCALPISRGTRRARPSYRRARRRGCPACASIQLQQRASVAREVALLLRPGDLERIHRVEIGRASCRERV